VVWAIALIGAFYLFTLALGYGAAALVGPTKSCGARGQTQRHAAGVPPRGVVLLGIISAVAFATILAVVAVSPSPRQRRSRTTSTPVC